MRDAQSCMEVRMQCVDAAPHKDKISHLKIQLVYPRSLSPHPPPRMNQRCFP